MLTNAASVAEATKEKLESFKKHLPLLHVVCNPSMQKRHWTQVSDIVGFTIRPDQGTDLIKLVDIGINDYIQELEVISTAATQEGTIEKGLQKIADVWTPAEFEFKEYKDTGTSVLVGTSVDMVQELLDDHTIKVQGMRGSAYAKPFQRTISDLEHFLQSTQDIVDMWLKVQSHWLYLQPIMTAPDIARQLPAEGKSFAAVDNMWRNIMRQAAAAPACTQVVRIDRLLEQLTKAHVALFCCGLVTDVAATSGMAASVQGKITWDFHTISGYTALVLMTLVTISGLYAIIKDHAGIRNNFHRASVPVWCVWMVSWITGVMLGLQKV